MTHPLYPPGTPVSYSGGFVGYMADDEEVYALGECAHWGYWAFLKYPGCADGEYRLLYCTKPEQVSLYHPFGMTLAECNALKDQVIP